LVTYSEDFSQSFWTKRDITLSSGFSAPDGSMNASKLVANAADSSLFNVFTVASGTTYSISFYLKTISGSLETTIGLGSPGFPQNEGEGGRYKNITVTDEWQRFTLTSTADASAATGVSFGGFNGFSTGEEVYIWGAQLEEGSATSLIPTSGAAASRTTFSDFYNASEGTTYMEVVPEPSASTSVLFEYMDESAGANEIMGSYLTSGTSYFYAITSGSFVANTSLGTTTNLSELNRIAVSYKVNDMFGSINGATSFRYTSLALPTGIDKLAIGNDNSSNLSITGRIRRLIYWPYHSDSL
jgi:hypothetical protein